MILMMGIFVSLICLWSLIGAHIVIELQSLHAFFNFINLFHKLKNAFISFMDFLLQVCDLSLVHEVGLAQIHKHLVVELSVLI